MSASKKIVKPEGQEPDEIETQVAQELLNLEQSSTEIKAELKELYFLSAKEVEVGGGKKAIILFVPFGLLKSYHKNWDHYHWGFIPFGLFVVVTYALVKQNILTWQDPIQALLEKGADEPDEEKGALLSPKEVEMTDAAPPATSVIA